MMCVLFLAFLSLELVVHSEAEAEVCKDVKNEDIDWERVNNKGPWYDVIEIPKTEEPFGCWTLTNSTRTEFGVRLYLEVFGTGIPQDSVNVDFDLSNTGIYKLVGDDGRILTEEYYHLGKMKME